MRAERRHAWVGLVAFLVAGASLPLRADDVRGGKLYRYTLDDGSTVLNFSVPPEYVHRGYTVLSASGTVLEVVPPSMTVEERERLAASEPDRIRAIEEAARQQEEDRRLLALYSSPADAERARDRKLEVLQLQISGDRGNISRLQTDLSNTQEAAANRERAGMVVPGEVNDKVDSLLRQIKGLQEGVDRREDEIRQIRETYQHDIDRMRYLIDHPAVVSSLRAQEAARRGAPPLPGAP